MEEPPVDQPTAWEPPADWVLEREDEHARYYRRPDGGQTKVYRSMYALLDD